MALKSNFSEASFISSPFVDEVANPGVPGISNEEVERQAVRANQLFLAKQAADDFISGRKKSPKPSKPPTAPSGFLRTDPKGRAEDINKLSQR